MAMTVFLPETLMFLRYWFESINLGEIYTGTSIPQVNNKDIYPMIFPLPPLAEQERIVNQLNELFAAME